MLKDKMPAKKQILKGLFFVEEMKQTAKILLSIDGTEKFGLFGTRWHRRFVFDPS